MKKLILITLAAAVIAAIVGFLLYNKPHRDTASATSDFIVEAPALLQEFTQDETAANQKYLDKVVAVKGKVKLISADDEGNLNLILDANDAMAGVICTIPKADVASADGVKEGDEVVVKGVCTGVLMDVVLVRCVVAEKA
ncbi:OB-fold protein [Pontibacter populi]|uniref:Nucleic acid binding protein n=1 Tax=Pontibacter populi TaxID=890055 RepID=A0ABV1RYJ9_9BACT